MSSAKFRQICLSLNVLIAGAVYILNANLVIIVPADAYMMTSSNGNIFRVTGHLCGEFTGLRWIPRTKASDAELWCII